MPQQARQQRLRQAKRRRQAGRCHRGGGEGGGEEACGGTGQTRLHLYGRTRTAAVRVPSCRKRGACLRAREGKQRVRNARGSQNVQNKLSRPRAVHMLGEQKCGLGVALWDQGWGFCGWGGSNLFCGVPGSAPAQPCACTCRWRPSICSTVALETPERATSEGVSGRLSGRGGGGGLSECPAWAASACSPEALEKIVSTKRSCRFS